MRAVKTIFSICFLLTLLSCSLCGCNSEKGTTQFTRTDITTLENIPEYGDTLALLPGINISDSILLFFSSPASLGPGFPYVINDHSFILTKDLDGLVMSVFSEDSSLITPEGVYVGMPIGKASELVNGEILGPMGWAYVVNLPCGWNAASWYLPDTDYPDSIIQKARIYFLYKE